MDAYMHASPRDYYCQIKKGFERYQEFIRGERLPNGIKFDLPDESKCFHRPKIAVVIFSENPIPPPAMIFGQAERDIVVYRVDPYQTQANEVVIREMVNQLEWNYQSNRLKLIVLLGALEAPKVPWFRRLMNRRYFDLIAVRKAIPNLVTLRMAIENFSQPIRVAIEDQELAIVESLYDPSLNELYFDISGTMEEGHHV